jgi:ABC-type amino acid transport system permease subunit
MIALVYLLITLLLSKLVSIMEEKLKYYERS